MTATSSASFCAERRRGVLAVIAAVAVASLTGCATAASTPRVSVGGGGAPRAAAGATTDSTTASTDPANRPAAGPPYPVGEQVFHLIDGSRTIRYPHRRRQARPLVTVVRYPEGIHGPVPLIVFGHGFAVTPAFYWRLLRSWAQAGYVVAAPVFPLENEHAPGGPDESDLVNQPRDMSFVISQLLALSASGHGPLGGLIAANAIGVSGQSDGGEAALAAAYDSYYRDPRIRAAAILSGAELPGAGRFYFPASSPPLLATQGTDDDVNKPHFTYDFFAAAPRPKYLLKLLGAPHLPPYTSEQPQLSIIGRVTTAFFDRYLKGQPTALGRMTATGNVAGVARLTVRR